jgi:predicted ABC-type ATPase
MPTLSVIAGPNGSGKSTLTSSVWFAGGANLIDPDAIARRLESTQPALAAIPAAREAILRCKALLAERESFALETTLAGHGAISIMRQAKAGGYRTFLVYVSLGNPDLHIERVRLRVSRGGHDIPDSDIRWRYWRSLSRALEALHLVDEAVVLDNSGVHPVRMLWFKGGEIVWRADTLPDWVEQFAAPRIRPFRLTQLD